MGYDLYFTRAADWTESDDHPITFAEWLEFAAGRPDLVESGTITYRGVGEQPIYVWTGPDGTEVSLDWFEGKVTITGVPDASFARAVAILAVPLGARAVGEEGEEYAPLE